ncbi:MAG: hypothetical protein K9I85_10995 [Saprospiraceae bacterium]|nr:hypothetical protein [Saprospiraceae bacterium]
MMKTKLYVSLLIAFSWLQLTAQDATFRVTDVHGMVTYQETKLSTPQRVWPGGKLPVFGMVNVPEGAGVNLLDGNTLHRLKDMGVYDLEKFYNIRKEQSLSFTNRFWNYVNNGLRAADTVRDLEKYHQNFMAVSGGVKGYGPGDQGLILLAPLPGKIGLERVAFRWERQAHPGVYRFTLIEAESGKTVYQAEVADSVLSVNLVQLGLQKETTYRWQVATEGEGAMLKAELSFEFADPSEAAVSRNLDNLKDYHLADEKEKRWMKATILEMEGYMYEAQITFAALLEDYPDDGYIRNLYSLFLTRQNDVKRAKAVWPGDDK